MMKEKAVPVGTDAAVHIELFDKLEFERIIIYFSVRGCPFRIQIFQQLHR